jgi:hypothetical protein
LSTRLLAGVELQLVTSDSLKELARANGGKAVSGLDVELPVGSLHVLATGAEVIVHGRIQTIESRLTKDERFVLTYFSLSPQHVFKDTIGLSVSSNRPRNTEPLVFAQPGGTVRVDGLEITYRTNVAAEPPFQVGEEVIAFLNRSPEFEAFVPHYGPFGLLRVRNGSVVAANKDVEGRRPLASTALADVQRQIQALLRSSRDRE